jgi:hypothetical protein
MISLAQLWLPIVLSAVAVFVASSLLHTVINWHASDYWKLPDEEAARAALRKDAPKPGQYIVPWCTHGPDMKSEEMQRKFREGPVAMIYVRPTGAPHMGGALGAWFAFVLVMSALIGYVAAVAAPAGSTTSHVFRIVAVVAFLAYGGGAPVQAIWIGQPWRAAVKDMVVGAVYAAVTGALFAWLWPQV